MKRSEFVRKAIGYILLVLIAMAAAITGSRADFASDCDSCPGKGICRGETDCSTYIPDYGRRKK